MNVSLKVFDLGGKSWSCLTFKGQGSLSTERTTIALSLSVEGTTIALSLYAVPLIRLNVQNTFCSLIFISKQKCFSAVLFIIYL